MMHTDGGYIGTDADGSASVQHLQVGADTRPHPRGPAGERS
jgi:hypothetical protein